MLLHVHHGDKHFQWEKIYKDFPLSYTSIIKRDSICTVVVSVLKPLPKLLISEVFWHSPESNFAARVTPTILYYEFENQTLTIAVISPGTQWVNVLDLSRSVPTCLAFYFPLYNFTIRDDPEYPDNYAFSSSITGDTTRRWQWRTGWGFY